jgi:type I restriction enzyme, S subunit
MNNRMLPCGWELSKGENLFELVRGVTFKKAEASELPHDDYIAILRAGNLQDGHILLENLVFVPSGYVSENQMIRKHDLIIAMSSGSRDIVGKAAPVTTDIRRTSFGAFCGLLRPLDLEIADWLKHFVQTQEYRKYVSDISAGININNLKREHLLNLDVPIAPINEQKKVVRKLESLQSRSTKARKALEAIPPLLENFRQSVLSSAFRGDLTAEWRAQNPDIEPAKKLLERIRKERRKRWEEDELAKMKAKGQTPKDDKWKKKYKEPEPVGTTGLPELPEGWCWARWEEVGFCQNGRAFPSKQYASEGVKLLRPGNLHVSGNVEWNDNNTRFMPKDWEEKYPFYIIEANELVINLTAQSLKDEFLGRICLTSAGEHCMLNQRIARLTPIILNPKFILFLLKSPYFREYVDSLNTGTLIQHMFSSQIENFMLPLPPQGEQKVIQALVESLLAKNEKIAEQVIKAKGWIELIDQSILSKAFRGELVPQDPNDEPASQLLERIKQQMISLEAEKKKRGSKGRAAEGFSKGN